MSRGRPALCSVRRIEKDECELRSLGWLYYNYFTCASMIVTHLLRKLRSGEETNIKKKIRGERRFQNVQRCGSYTDPQKHGNELNRTGTGTSAGTEWLRTKGQDLDAEQDTQATPRPHPPTTMH